MGGWSTHLKSLEISVKNIYFVFVNMYVGGREKYVTNNFSVNG